VRDDPIETPPFPHPSPSLHVLSPSAETPTTQLTPPPTHTPPPAAAAPAPPPPLQLTTRMFQMPPGGEGAGETLFIPGLDFLNQ
jgi:hypothetical protein